MELFDIDFLSLVSKPSTAVAAGAASMILFQVWKVLDSILNPVKYVEKLYGIADNIVEKVDDRIIDKIRNKRIKGDVQESLRKVLLGRRKKINALIRRISD